MPREIWNLATRTPSIHEIVSAVSEVSGVEADRIEGNTRTPDVVQPRFAVCFLARDLTSHSFPSIGTKFGYRDHTTIIHGVKRAKEMIENKDASFLDLIAKTRTILSGNGAA